MRTLRLLGWSVLILGLLVTVTALLYAAVLDEDQRRESFIASTKWNTAKAAEIDRRHDHTKAWPALFAGTGLIVMGLTLLAIRHRMLLRADRVVTPAEFMPLIVELGPRGSPPVPRGR